jgi:hypothetical protein
MNHTLTNPAIADGKEGRRNGSARPPRFAGRPLFVELVGIDDIGSRASIPPCSKAHTHEIGDGFKLTVKEVGVFSYTVDLLAPDGRVAIENRIIPKGGFTRLTDTQTKWSAGVYVQDAGKKVDVAAPGYASV